MTGMTMLAIAIVVLRRLFRLRQMASRRSGGVDPSARRPRCVLKTDGTRPSGRWTVFAHPVHLDYRAGPVTGPIIGPCSVAARALWMLVGGIFFGAVQDFCAPLRVGEEPRPLHRHDH